VNRAGGASPHIHPWYFYLQRLFFYHPGKGLWFTEILILALALTAFGTALLGRGLSGANTTLVRLVGFYTLFLTAAYSVISYKTPWCFLAFLHSMILLAGVGAVAVVSAPRPVWLKWSVAALLLAATAQLGWQAWRDSFPFAARRQNPHVYAHTSPDIANLVEMVQGVAKAHPQGPQLLVKVIARDDDYWPLPWSLRDFRNVGWFGQMPADPLAPLMIVSTKLQSELSANLNDRYQPAGLFELRPGVFLELYVEKDLWKKFLATRPKPE
jgi:predicted membrane-bound mannosyltransferase